MSQNRLDEIAARIDAAETVEQIECFGLSPSLSKLLALSREKGHYGIIVIDQGGGKSPYVGAFLSRDGVPTGQTMATHETPESALVALGG